MPIFVFNDENDPHVADGVRRVWGVPFPLHKEVNVDEGDLARKLRALGQFLEISDNPPQADEDEREALDLHGLKAAELKALAAAKGIELPGRPTKAQLIAELEAWQP